MNRISARGWSKPSSSLPQAMFGKSNGFSVHVLVLLFAILASCSPPLYDEQTDKAITALQRQVDGRMLQLITLARRTDKGSIEKASYTQNTDFYNEADTDLTIIETRMLASPDRSTGKLAPVFKNLRGSLADLRQLHEAQDHLGEAFLLSTRNQLNVQIATLLTYELSLKSGPVAVP